MNYIRLNEYEILNLDKVYLISFIDEELTIEFKFEVQTKYFKANSKGDYEYIKNRIGSESLI